MSHSEEKANKPTERENDHHTADEPNDDVLLSAMKPEYTIKESSRQRQAIAQSTTTTVPPVQSTPSYAAVSSETSATIPTSTPSTSATPVHSAVEDHPVKLGPDGKGGYYTPYSVTIVHLRDDVFAECISQLVDRAQSLSVDATSIASFNCDVQYISPILLLMCDGFTEMQYQLMREKGFTKLFAFSKTTTFPSFIQPLHLDTFHTEIKIKQGLAAMIIFEYLQARYYPHCPSDWGDDDIKSEIKQHSANFCKGLEVYKQGPAMCVKRIIDSRFLVFDTIQAVITEGRTYIEFSAQLAMKALNESYEMKTNLNIQLVNFPLSVCEYILEVLPLHASFAGCDIAIIYHHDGAHWIVTILALKTFSAPRFATEYFGVIVDSGELGTVRVKLNDDPRCLINAKMVK